jgi:hypothetical protein
LSEPADERTATNGAPAAVGGTQQPGPDSNGVVRTSTGWRKLLHRG